MAPRVKFVPWGEWSPLRSPPPGVNTLHCLEKWGRGYQRIPRLSELSPGDNFTVPLLPLKGFKLKTFFPAPGGHKCGTRFGRGRHWR
jgi:hypothetical protein